MKRSQANRHPKSSRSRRAPSAPATFHPFHPSLRQPRSTPLIPVTTRVPIFEPPILYLRNQTMKNHPKPQRVPAVANHKPPRLNRARVLRLVARWVQVIGFTLLATFKLLPAPSTPTHSKPLPEPPEPPARHRMLLHFEWDR